MGSLHGHEPGISRLAGQRFPDAAIVSGRLPCCPAGPAPYGQGMRTSGRRACFLWLRRPDAPACGPNGRNGMGHTLTRQPALHAVCESRHDLAGVSRIKGQTGRECRQSLSQLPDSIRQPLQSPSKPMRTLGKTLSFRQEEAARMSRLPLNNGITEGFHRKMKLIQHRAHEFRNSANYRLRVQDRSYL